MFKEPIRRKCRPLALSYITYSEGIECVFLYINEHHRQCCGALCADTGQRMATLQFGISMRVAHRLNTSFDSLSMGESMSNILELLQDTLAKGVLDRVGNQAPRSDNKGGLAQPLNHTGPRLHSHSHFFRGAHCLIASSDGGISALLLDRIGVVRASIILLES